jgi:hypothetical protein
MFAPMPVIRYDDHTPTIPPSSSTSLPNMYRKKRLLERWFLTAAMETDVACVSYIQMHNSTPPRNIL